MLPSLRKFISSVSEAEVSFIAGLDYGQDVEQHRDALRRLLDVQEAELTDGQSYHPYAVIELGAYALTPGHEREFVLCNLLVLNAVHTGFDTATDIAEKFSSMALAYDMLATELREMVLVAYSEAQS